MVSTPSSLNDINIVHTTRPATSPNNNQANQNSAETPAANQPATQPIVTPSSEHVKADPKPSTSAPDNGPVSPTSPDNNHNDAAPTQAPPPAAHSPAPNPQTAPAADPKTRSPTPPDNNHNNAPPAQAPPPAAHTAAGSHSSNAFAARQLVESETEVCVPILEAESTQVPSATPTPAGPETFVELISGNSETVTLTPATGSQPSPFVSTITTSVLGVLETIYTVVTPSPTADPSYTTFTYVTTVSGTLRTLVTEVPLLSQNNKGVTTFRTAPITILLDWPTSTTIGPTSGGWRSVTNYREVSLWVGVVCGFITLGLILL
jgi:hypothetical protein